MELVVFFWRKAENRREKKRRALTENGEITQA